MGGPNPLGVTCFLSSSLGIPGPAQLPCDILASPEVLVWSRTLVGPPSPTSMVSALPPCDPDWTLGQLVGLGGKIQSGPLSSSFSSASLSPHLPAPSFPPSSLHCGKSFSVMSKGQEARGGGRNGERNGVGIWSAKILIHCFVDSSDHDNAQWWCRQTWHLLH